MSAYVLLDRMNRVAHSFEAVNDGQARQELRRLSRADMASYTLAKKLATASSRTTMPEPIVDEENLS